MYETNLNHESPQQDEKKEIIADGAVISDSELYKFLKSLRLEHYFEDIQSNGGDRLGQLVYVEDSVIDQLCTASKMKIIHAGVLKRAIKDCRLTSRITSSDGERQAYAVKYEPNTGQAQYISHYQAYQADSHYNVLDRRRLLMTTNCPTADTVVYAQPIRYHQDAPSYNRTLFCAEEPSRPDTLAIQGECNTHTSNKSSETDQAQGSGFYNVNISGRNVRFPSSVKVITIMDQLDSEKKEIIKKGSQIYGRDDTKRKHNELTNLEILMNDIAYEICLRDFTFMISRQRLLGLVREIVKDNQLQQSGHHSYSFTAVASNGKTRQQNKVQAPPESTSTEQCLLSDYEAILYHKIHREWPAGIDREKRKHLGRRSSNFEAIDNVLYYAKDHRKRRWISEDSEILDLFNQTHTDPETGCHYSRDVTLERLTKKYYFKNMANVVSELHSQCVPCNTRYKLMPDEMPTISQTNASFNDSFQTPSMISSSKVNDLPPLEILESINSTKFEDPKKLTDEQPPCKKPRKSTPHKLIIENGEPRNLLNHFYQEDNLVCDETQFDASETIRSS